MAEVLHHSINNAATILTVQMLFNAESSVMICYISNCTFSDSETRIQWIANSLASAANAVMLRENVSIRHSQ